VVAIIVPSESGEPTCWWMSPRTTSLGPPAAGELGSALRIPQHGLDFSTVDSTRARATAADQRLLLRRHSGTLDLGCRARPIAEAAPRRGMLAPRGMQGRRAQRRLPCLSPLARPAASASSTAGEWPIGRPALPQKEERVLARFPANTGRRVRPTVPVARRPHFPKAISPGPTSATATIQLCGVATDRIGRRTSARSPMLSPAP
jgi:hypothetical protein